MNGKVTYRTVQSTGFYTVELGRTFHQICLASARVRQLLRDIGYTVVQQVSVLERQVACQSDERIEWLVESLIEEQVIGS